MTKPVILPVVFDDDAFTEDLKALTSRGRDALTAWRVELEAAGVDVSTLRKTAGEYQGTDLSGHVKLRHPDKPDGTWGAVLAFVRETTGFALRVVAVGERHPRQEWRPSVYEIAHRRINSKD